jgi:hypothetical protein
MQLQITAVVFSFCFSIACLSFLTVYAAAFRCLDCTIWLKRPLDFLTRPNVLLSKYCFDWLLAFAIEYPSGHMSGMFTLVCAREL